MPSKKQKKKTYITLLRKQKPNKTPHNKTKTKLRQ